MPGRQRSFLVSETSGRAGLHGVDGRGTSSHPILAALVAAGCLSSVQQDEWRIPCASGNKGGVILTSAI